MMTIYSIQYGCEDSHAGETVEFFRTKRDATTAARRASQHGEVTISRHRWPRFPKRELINALNGIEGCIDYTGAVFKTHIGTVEWDDDEDPEVF